MNKLIIIVVLIIVAIAVYWYISSPTKVVTPTTTGPNANSTVVPVPAGTMVQFVRITKDASKLLLDEKALSLAEVQVFSNGVNVAGKGTASQVSTAYGGDASRAIDGNTDGQYWDQSVSHTGNVDDEWWEVNLGHEYPVDKVVIWNRTDCCTNRLNGAKVLLNNADGETVKSYVLTGAREQTFTV